MLMSFLTSMVALLQVPRPLLHGERYCPTFVFHSTVADHGHVPLVHDRPSRASLNGCLILPDLHCWLPVISLLRQPPNLHLPGVNLPALLLTWAGGVSVRAISVGAAWAGGVSVRSISVGSANACRCKSVTSKQASSSSRCCWQYRQQQQQ